ITYAIPVLMLLYPLATVLIIMALCERTFGKSKYVYAWVTLGAFIPAVFDFCKTMPEGVQNALNIPALTALGQKIFPFFDLGLGWVVPALIGLVIGLVLTAVNKNKGEKAAA
ncbi:MAG: branched-chain amino acid transport system II carrier protein, partial [Clostridia bacterium]